MPKDDFMNSLFIIFGKKIKFFSRIFNLGSGSTWPGHIALSLNKNFIKEILKKNPNLKTVLIAGTNGKTTTGKLVKTIFEENKFSVFQNESGANLLNGIASSLISESDIFGKISKQFAIFEVDENALPLALNEINPDYILLLDLFRDQLDRYGEVDSIAKKWKKSLEKISKNTKVILNADDPLVASLGNNLKANIYYFGLNNKNLNIAEEQTSADSIYCPNCNSELNYETKYFSHLGIWNCPNCKLKRPETDSLKLSAYPLPGVYNMYNTQAAVLLSRIAGIDSKVISSALHKFLPAFGRQETIQINGKKAHLFLSKNPTSFNESLRTIKDLGAKNVLFILNDRIPDGRDVSWIWDINIEEFSNNFKNITISGDRVYDIALRLKYADISGFEIKDNLKEAVEFALKRAEKDETLYILPTYSAMLDLRKILTGKKIL